MNTTARTAAIATGLTMIPFAIAAGLFYKERQKSFSERMSDRLRDLFHHDDSPEAHMRRIGRRIDALGERLDAYGHDAAGRVDSYGRSAARAADRYGHAAARRIHDTSPETRMIAGAVGVALIPALLAVIFPRQRDAVIDGVKEYFDNDDFDEQINQEFDAVSERLSALSADIERHRDASYDEVTSAADAHRD